MKKIAPTLQGMIPHLLLLNQDDVAVVERAKKELRALLSVAKAARRIMADPDFNKHSLTLMGALHKALSRLDKASAPPAAPKEEG